MDAHRETNRRRWDELTPLHAASAFYDVAGFKAGGSSLKSIEVEEVGDVVGRRLLHLQCHFGLDTLSWARRGACVTGVDFSEAAVAQARALAEETGLPATFLCAAVEALPDVLTGAFDVVFTSYGVLCWLSDLRPWARTVAHFLEPGGFFYIVETHPFAEVFDDAPGAADLRVGYSYFSTGEPILCQTRGTYADREAQVGQTTSYQWAHTLGDVVNALVGAGLRLDFLHEFPMGFFPKLSGMARSADGWWRLPEARAGVPLLFSLKAHKPW
jgi:SAM-dependent methyltransferase